MMYGRYILLSSLNVRAHLGFAPHQLSGVLQTRTDKPVYFVKAHSLPIVPSHVVWRVSAAAPTASMGKLSPFPPPKLDLPEVKWTAAPLPEIKDVTEEPAFLKQFTQSSRKHASTPIGKALTNTNDGSMRKNLIPHLDYNLDAIEVTPQSHHKPRKIHESVALLGVKMLRFGFDLLPGYRGPGGAMTVQDWLNRCLFLEAVAGVSGIVAGIARHLRSIKRGYGTLLEDAENYHIHLQIFMNMKQPGWLFQMTVLAAQGIFFPAFFVAYMASPKTCHRFVGFLEEEAVKTYTNLLEEMEHGHLDEWCTTTAPLIGRNYYNLPDDAKVYDMIKCIRADEANHSLASLDQKRGVTLFGLLK